MAQFVPSPLAAEALQILGVSIRAGRLRRRWTVAELAERVGVSRPTIAKVERGDPSAAIGTVFEAAALVGVPLFEQSDTGRHRYALLKQAELALLPSSARTPRKLNDDF